MDLYTAIVVITMALLVVNIVDVCTDRLADKTATIRFITVCVIIGLAQMGEWIGVKTNGAEPALRQVWSARFSVGRLRLCSRVSQRPIAGESVGIYRQAG